jgi:chaperonin GroES
MRRIKPTGTKVLVQPLVGGNEMVNGLHIPEAHRDQQSMDAVVVQVGTGLLNSPVKVGDRVVTSRYGGTEVKVGSTFYRLIEVKELLAVVE